ncbi:hypothetical protein BG015_010166 [Linnemannia schmuckeri]|uniref:Uncharacterized protein n=1 Tax=Linnemannia schmuckeri TaxID=64567 RepID=A0A9P5V925_9FUNG|nr:hypothetical protein BG015_010166 [Linnemannia schmuckeri]
MMLSFRSLFQSESQRQVEAEARNIGLAHSIRDLITGSNHETHVDSYQKKKAVKALQKAKPAEVNNLINILKAMPDPTVVEFKEVHSREASRHHHPAPEPQEPKPSTGDTATTGAPTEAPTTSEPDGEEGNSSKDKESEKEGEEEEVEEVKAPSSWWAVSFASLKATLISEPAVGEPSVTTTTTTVTTITMTAEEVKKAAAEAEAAEAAEAEAAKAKAAEQEAAVTAAAEGAETVVVESTVVKKDKGVATATATATETENKNIGTITSSTTVANTKTTADKTTLVSTLNSIKKQIVALTKTPPIDVISAYTYWWGYEIYVPHKCMNKLQRVSNTSQIFFGFLSGAVAGVPGLAALVPFSRIISAWVGFQWAVIQAEDLGKGVVLSATWVLPVALAPRSWDHPGTE